MKWLKYDMLWIGVAAFVMALGYSEVAVFVMLIPWILATKPDKNRILLIEVEGGCLRDVHNLPDDWYYEIWDIDNLAEQEGLGSARAYMKLEKRLKEL